MRWTILIALRLSAAAFGQQQRTAGDPGCPKPSCAPIVVDTANTGLEFTDPLKGEYVTFDIKGNGKPVKLSWPKVEACANLAQFAGVLNPPEKMPSRFSRSPLPRRAESSPSSR